MQWGDHCQLSRVACSLLPSGSTLGLHTSLHSRASALCLAHKHAALATCLHILPYCLPGFCSQCTRSQGTTHSLSAHAPSVTAGMVSMGHHMLEEPPQPRSLPDSDALYMAQVMSMAKRQRLSPSLPEPVPDPLPMHQPLPMHDPMPLEPNFQLASMWDPTTLPSLPPFLPQDPLPLLPSQLPLTSGSHFQSSTHFHSLSLDPSPPMFQHGMF